MDREKDQTPTETATEALMRLAAAPVHAAAGSAAAAIAATADHAGAGDAARERAESGEAADSDADSWGSGNDPG